MFNNSNPFLKNICLKTWLACENSLYSTSDLSRCTEYLLEGLYFNRCFAPDMYLGIAPIFSEEPHSLTCGPLIQEPQINTITMNQSYVLVMKRLDDSSRLDHQLKISQFGNKQGMEFLATSIANIHQCLEVSPASMGTLELLEAKLETNLKLFRDALQDLPVEKRDERNHETISRQLKEFIHLHADLFRQRYAEQPPKRCHGDLKATNLWIDTGHRRNSRNRIKHQRLLALDCIDFRPDFCHIDTLSDVAMLAVDLEMRMTPYTTHSGSNPYGQILADHFILTYLNAANETDRVRPLLEYYMTEKAMVGAFMSIHFDSLPSLGEKYLKVALAHAAKLEKYLQPKSTLQEAHTTLKKTPVELNLQPVGMIEQIDTAVPVFDYVLVPGKFSQLLSQVMHTLRKD